MPLRIAFAGFRHPHILALHRAARSGSDFSVTAACEEHEPTRKELADKVVFTHDTLAGMLDCGMIDVVAIGDVYARRGAIAKAALERGLHVISDKPLCTSLKELEEIERLATEKRLAVGCQLDLGENAAMLALRRVITDGRIGEPLTLTFAAQHPLRLGQRAGWYFEPGLHGGTINDIGVHAFDLATWLTGQPWSRLLSAREWNAKAAAHPHFKDSAQVHGVLENGVGFFGDFSYLAPDRAGYSLPHYWRVTVHGTRGVAETFYDATCVQVCADEDESMSEVPVGEAEPDRYLGDFVAELSGRPREGGLTTTRVLAAARLALEIQAAARE